MTNEIIHDTKVALVQNWSNPVIHYSFFGLLILFALTISIRIPFANNDDNVIRIIRNILCLNVKAGYEDSLSIYIHSIWITVCIIPIIMTWQIPSVWLFGLIAIPIYYGGIGIFDICGHSHIYWAKKINKTNKIK